MSKAVTKKEDNLPSAIEDIIFENAGDGIDYDTSELQIPFLRIAQAMSPQLKKSENKFIPGCSQGDLFNTVTGEFWSGEDGIYVIPCYQDTKYLEFVPRGTTSPEGKTGFQGEIAPNDPVLQQAKRDGSKEILPNGNELIKSDQHYCIIVSGDVPQFAILDMKVSQLKISRRWKTQIAMLKIKNKDGKAVTPSLYSNVWKFSTVEESNPGGTFFNYIFERHGFVQDKNVFQEAKNFRESIMKGEAKAVTEDIVDEQDSVNVKDDDAPF
tara:strand:- start:243 stop:1046 length:804 start_codon:yes stop_codon:yes gene_type:complete